MPTSDIHIKRIDETYIQIIAEDSTLRELFDAFRFKVEGYRYMPLYKMKVWDGYVNLFNLKNNHLYRGLIPHVVSFAISRQYTYTIENSLIPGNEGVDVKGFINSIPVSSKGVKIEPKEHQTYAIEYGIKHKRGLLLSPTSSGKSLIAYFLVRWYLENCDKKILIIVPTTGLVTQLRGDFIDYSEMNGFPADDHIHEIYSGQDKNSDKRIFISTWQSIYKLGRDYFRQFGMIIGDEAHMYQANSVKNILQNAVDTEYKIGMTGTLSGAKCHELVLQGLFGKMKKVITTKELMDQGDISTLSIEMLNLQYTEQERKDIKNLTYQEEIAWLVQCEKRNKFIRNLAESTRGNTLVLCSHVEAHSNPMYDALKKSGKKTIYLVTGDTPREERDAIRKLAEKESDIIIVATYGVFSTGINIINLHNIIFSMPSKSTIRVLQSLGRGLRKGKNKFKAKLFDISDDLSWKSHKNYSLKHAMIRKNIYDTEKHSYRWVDMNL